LTVLGLAFDVVGVVLIYLYGLPPRVNPQGQIFLISEQADPAEVEKARRYHFRAHAGLALILAGFVLQLLGTVAQQLGWWRMTQ
jgi:hypothetical protein